MKIIRQHAYGAPEVLELEDLELPAPGLGEVLLRTHAAAVTFFDILNRRGDLARRDYYKADAALPLEPGYQGSGYVEALGPDVTGVEVGDRVAWALAAGSYASHVIAPAAQLIPVPDDIGLDEAAGLPVQGLLAYKLTHEAYPLSEGDWALVQSAAGGVGTLITQFAGMRGARVIGVVSSEEKAPVAKEAGAEEVIVSTTTADLPAEVRRITGGKGVQVVYDAVGKDTFADNLDSLASRGYLVNFGQASGFVPPLDLMTLNDKGSLYVTRFCLPHFFDESWPPLDFLARAFQWMREGKLSVRIDSRYPLAQAAEAHAAVEQRRTSGRVLLIP
ncbi:quinone oxidoreductase family protein [Streptosporangium saharense]|uniref:NADPH2:quinone reductase n=1 Tax=Streptosporangium saharense TaxID=1706840 RepID=A0A7W7VQH6_9ACTN|nr:quinone oxidoreductase [Streptosporangium saharense]MBB4919032.1 NADPH2:quinone reductase [Streptosporangium saharense]